MNCIDFDSLIMRPLLVFRVVIEYYQDYLIDDEILPANWELAQMNSGCSNCITCECHLSFLENFTFL